MLIEIHAIQNHSPANLNRDDLGAPKSCYFGGVLRSRISSQCIKRSIRTSESFKALCGGIRTRQLGRLIGEKNAGEPGDQKRAVKVLEKCGIKTKDDDKSDMLVYTTNEAIAEMATLLREGKLKSDEQLAGEFGKLISQHVAVPDMALSGRMLETGVLIDTTVEAALQVAHAISTHEARPEVDYYVAADDIPGDDAGAGFVGEAMFASACFYKYFCIHWETLLNNLKGQDALAAHTIGAFIRGAALTNPTGKQNSFAAHNPPDGILIEINNTPISYANASAAPVVAKGEREIIAQSIAQLGQYVHDIEVGYGGPTNRFWFSPNNRYPLTVTKDKQDIPLTANNLPSLEKLISDVIAAIGYDWNVVQKEVVNPGVAS